MLLLRIYSPPIPLLRACEPRLLLPERQLAPCSFVLAFRFETGGEDGFPVGLLDGFADGLVLGNADGCVVGLRVGCGVGDVVGDAVGPCVGLVLGAHVSPVLVGAYDARTI